ncbi:MAG: ATP-binding protein [Acidobacteriia bacterium]|nr:ATP-binding protein [Terriglobia bacterium]
MTMFLSVEQIRNSLPSLAHLHPFFGMAFLAFKEAELPVGRVRTIVFSQAVQRILERHYKPTAAHAGFYNPFQTSDQSNRWTASRYGSTSLQRITTDTFGDALIHKKAESSWGWRQDYVERLQQHLGERRIPAFHLAVWLFRGLEWPSEVSPQDVVLRLILEYRLTKKERRALFNERVPPLAEPWISEKPVSEADLLSLIGPPAGAALRSLEIRDVGPTKALKYEPAERLNIITGNNSLGKTFLLECLWWALTGEWIEYPAMPRRDNPKRGPKILFTLTSLTGRVQNYSASYNWDRQVWTTSPGGSRLPGLVIYARFDGSFAIWDPARSQLMEPERTAKTPGRIFLTREQVWNGTQADTAEGRERWVCNGLLRDWLIWQTGGERYKQQYSAFISSLTELSPSTEELRPGEPIRISLESREIPTLLMSYGEVPILHASAAVQRIVALAYTLVWAWHEHLVTSSIARREPQRYLVLIVDEVEAHLHPLWQRVIVPAIMQVASNLATAVKPQLHVATHSPLVMASAETVFDESRDGLHHLKLIEGNVALEELPFVKRGRADLWLVSDAFGLGQARSLPAEQAIEEAKRLQLAPDASPDRVREVHTRLVKFLAPDDEYWPRWLYFAQQRGVAR